MLGDRNDIQENVLRVACGHVGSTTVIYSLAVGPVGSRTVVYYLVVGLCLAKQ